MFKKIIAVSTATMLTIAMSVSAFAATQAEIDAFVAKLPQTYQEEAAAKLANADLSKDDLDYLAKKLGTIKAELELAGIHSVAEAQAAIKEGNGDKFKAVKKAVDDAKAAAAEKKITITVTLEELADNATKFTVEVPTVKSPEKPNPGPSGKGDNEPTKPGKGGADFSTTAAVVAGLGLAVAGVAVVAKKKDLVNA